MEASRMPNVTSAESALGWHIPRPDFCGANDDIVSDVYVSVPNGQAFIRYAEIAEGCAGFAGGHVELVASPPLPDEAFVLTPSEVLAEFERGAAAMGAIASVSSIGDLPVLLVSGHYSGDCDRPLPGQEGCSPPQSNRAAARAFFDGVEVELYGAPEWSAIQILTLAGTVS